MVPAPCSFSFGSWIQFASLLTVISLVSQHLQKPTRVSQCNCQTSALLLLKMSYTFVSSATFCPSRWYLSRFFRVLLLILQHYMLSYVCHFKDEWSCFCYSLVMHNNFAWKLFNHLRKIPVLNHSGVTSLK